MYVIISHTVMYYRGSIGNIASRLEGKYANISQAFNQILCIYIGKFELLADRDKSLARNYRS